MRIKTVTNENRSLTVGVLMGGTSSERDVSMTSGTHIADSLERTGFQVKRIVLEKDVLPDDARSSDVIFPALHGGFGENGGIQECLEAAGLPYIGSGPESSRICMDKEATKLALKEAGLIYPKSMTLVEPGQTLDTGMHLPLVVKPTQGGSSVLLYICNTQEEFDEAMVKALESGEEAMIEQYVSGTELTVALLDGEPLPPVEIVPPNGVYDYDAKYVYANGKTQYFCPPRDLGPLACDQLSQVAKRAWDALGMTDLGRVDIIMARDYTPYILEANTLPGFTPTSLVPKAAGQAGITYDELCAHLVLTAYERGPR